jgi:hypothetical protein
VSDDDRNPWDVWRGRIQASRDRRDLRLPEWQENVSRRSPTVGQTNAASVNQDWPLTKAKIAQLYSQTPEVRLTPRDDVFGPIVPKFGRIVNDTVGDASVGAAIEEVLSDVINASGIGGVLISCEHRTVLKQVPLLDPAMVPPGMTPPMAMVQEIVDRRYPIQRISPTDLLIPSDFTGSMYDQCRWLGYDGRMTWPQAMASLGLTEDQEDEVLGSDKRTTGNSLNITDATRFSDTEVVNFTELFYWTHFYDEKATSFHRIHRLVFVDGIEEPVVDEPYKGQQEMVPGVVVGVTHLPLQILTLTYVSDEGMPPSDSSIGKYQVVELEASRDAMVQQRKHSIPIRWYDTNRISANTRSLLEKGTYQGFIPTNGPGERAVGEVSRASFPQEKFEFDRIIKTDLSEIWQVGTNQSGQFASGERSASEARIVQQNFQKRIGQERDKVTRFFVRITEVVAGLLAIYDDLTGLQLPQGVPKEAIANGFVYTVRVDSTLLLDASEQIDQLQKGLNLTAQSGYVNPKPIIAKIWELLGEDPETILIDPQPKAPEPVKVSVSKAEDLMNPLFLALLNRTQQGPAPADIEAAKQQLMSVMTPPAPPQPPMGPQGPQDGAPPPEGIQTPEIANPGWESAPRLERRQADGGA